MDSLVQDAIKNALQAPAIKERVQKAAEKAIAEAIDSAFDYRSAFRESIKNAVTEVLPTVNATDLATFAHATKEVIQRRLANLALDTAKAHVDEMLESILPESKVIGLKELRGAYVEKIRRSSHGCHCDDEYDDEPSDFTWKIEKSTTVDGYFHLWMSSEEDVSQYSIGKDKISLSFTKPDADGLHECYHVVAGRDELEVRSLFVGSLYGFDAMLFRLATKQSKLRVDC